MKISNESFPLIEQAVSHGVSDEKSILEYAEKIAKFERHAKIEATDVAEAAQYRFEENAKDGMYLVNSVFVGDVFNKNSDLESIRRRVNLGITKGVNLKIVKVFHDIKAIIFDYFKPDAIVLLRNYTELEIGRRLSIRDLNRLYKIVSNIEISGKKAKLEDIASAVLKYGYK